MSAASPIAGRATGPVLPARLETALLVLLMAVSAALGFWYLPAAQRQSVEGHGIENVEAKLGGGEVRHHSALPIAWAPQLLTIRTVDRLYEANPTQALHVATAKNKLNRRGRDMARYFSLLYGVAGLFFLHRIARRLHSGPVALLAVLILGFSPWHLQASVLFAPEILVLCLSSLVLWLGLRALDEPSPARLGLVGIALGVAAAAEPVGASIAVAVVPALVFGGGLRARRTLLALAITVPVALLVWWLLTPPAQLISEGLRAEQAADAGRAVREMSSRFTVAVLGFLHPLRDSVHGRLIGTLALLGALGQAFRCLLLVDAGPDRTHRLMVLAAAPALILGTAALTPLYREGGFVPLVPLSSLYAAVMLGILWEGLRAAVPRLGSPRVAVVAAALVAALVVPPGWTYVQSRAVGSTLGAALDRLRKDLQVGGPRLVFVEEAALEGGAEAVTRMAQGLGVRIVPRLAAAEAQRLARLDGEIFLRAELEGDDGPFYRRRLEGAQRRRRVNGTLLWHRGPDLVAVARPYGAGPPEEVVLETGRRRGTWRATVPAASDTAGVVCLILQVPVDDDLPTKPQARLDGADLDLIPAGRFARHTLFVTERLPVAPEPRLLEVETPTWMPARSGELKITAYFWKPPDNPDSPEP